MRDVNKGMAAGALGMALVLFSAGQAPAIDLSRADIHGFMDLEYTQSSNDQQNNSTGNPNGSFHQHHLSLLMNVPVDDRVSAFMHIEFDHGVNTNAPNGGDIIVENSFITYTFSDQLEFRFGKALTPFGYFNEIHDATPAFLSVYIPHPIYRQERRGGTAMFPKWTTGVNLLGVREYGATVLDYIFYVGNGENVVMANEAELDSNRNKAFGGRIGVSPNERFSAAVSFYAGEKAESSDRLSVPHTTAGLMLNGMVRDVNILTEAAQSTVGGVTDTGAYLQLTCNAGKNATPYYRLEYTDPDQNTGGDTWTEHVIGINLRATESLTFKIEGANGVRGGNNSDILGDPPNYFDVRFAVTLYF